MFLSELYKYKKRMEADAASGMAPEGYSEENISFVLRIKPDGRLLDCISLLSDKGKARRMQVPAAVKRTVGIEPNFLWDNTGYVLGVDGKGKDERTAKTFAAFQDRHRKAVERSGNARIRAVSVFLDAWDPKTFTDLPDHELMLDANLVFRIEGDSCYVHEAPDVREAWLKLRAEDEGGAHGVCLITGKEGVISAVHPAVKGVPGAQSAGAALVSFNCEAFTSYGKEQSLNAPVSSETAEAYTSALNYLLRRDNHHVIQFGDASVIFWAENPGPAENFMYTLAGMNAMGEDPPAEDGETVKLVRAALDALKRGKAVREVLAELGPEQPFFVLGLAPNQARLVIRLWEQSSFGDMVERILRFRRELEMEREFPTQPKWPDFWQLMKEIAPQGKMENLPKNLGGGLARAVFSNLPYPRNFYSAVIGRIRADKRVGYLRAALLKACLIRNFKHEDMPVTLDSSRKDVPYLLGRLFSLLEKNQRDALGQLNANLADRYLAAASATPGMVFPRLLRLSTFHARTARSKAGVPTTAALKTMAAVMDDIHDFPARLSIVEQGVFFLGYQQQTNANYQKKEQEQA